MFILIGIGRKVTPCTRAPNISPDQNLDAADFYHTTMFSESAYDGLGSWGDPENDFQICTGGFKDITLAYPVPHHIRRNFTLRPLTWINFPGVPPAPLPVNPFEMVNTTFTKEVVNKTVNSWTGDYIKFQEYLEGFPGPHPGPHLILGGDLTGLCPSGLGPPGCNNGPRWSVNGERAAGDLIGYAQRCPPHRSYVFPSPWGMPYRQFHRWRADVHVVQMIDKIWYDWQRRDPSNKGAFAGGSVSGQMDPSLVAESYPTGGPPFLSVRGNLFNQCTL